jgi:Tol biopolymer transport system component
MVRKGRAIIYIIFCLLQAPNITPESRLASADLWPPLAVPKSNPCGTPFPTLTHNGRSVQVARRVYPVDFRYCWITFRSKQTQRRRAAGSRTSHYETSLGLRERHPALSRDGKKVLFFSGSNLVVKELVTGRETQLVEGVIPGASPGISPDGSVVVYYVVKSTGTEVDLYSVSAAGGPSRLVCRECGNPKGFSSDGARVLTERGFLAHGLARIALVDLATGKATDVLSDTQHNLFHPYYSWDDKWMTFKRQFGADYLHFGLYIAPVENFVPAGPERWIQLTGGEYNDDKPQLSPDGNTMYFTSNRDGFGCIWALRLNPKTKRPLGSPFPIQHFHTSQRFNPAISGSIDMELNVAKDKIVTNLDELHSDIWMIDLEPHR